jgi:mannose-6-phosphate isomerase-like protein (cupin superfamily)
MNNVRLDEQTLLASEIRGFGGPRVGDEERFQVEFVLNDPRAAIAHEAFLPNTAVNWAFWHDEVHIVTRGRAEVTYTLAPNHRKQVTKTFQAGDTYVIPDGARVRFEIGDEPYVHICVIMPRFEYSRDERMDSHT